MTQDVLVASNDLAMTAIADGRVCARCERFKSMTEFRRNGVGSRICKACCVDQEKDWRRRNVDRLRAKTKRYFADRSSDDVFETRQCLHCGADFRFHTASARDGKHPGKFCSKKCHSAHGRAVIKCGFCKKPFEVWRCMVDKRKYCSAFCAGTKLHQSQITDDVLRRIHYTSAAWRERSAEIVTRDHNECQECASGVDLVVHHIVPWLESRDDSPSNLITLCRSCHADKHRTPSGRLAGRASSLESVA